MAPPAAHPEVPADLVTALVSEAACDADPEKWQAIRQQVDERGKNQQGIARAKDLARYPLACHLMNLTGSSGSILYGRTTHGRTVHTCGWYMKTDGAECASNQVDAEAVLRFTLKTPG